MRDHATVTFLILPVKWNGTAQSRTTCRVEAKRGIGTASGN